MIIFSSWAFFFPQWEKNFSSWENFFVFWKKILHDFFLMSKVEFPKRTTRQKSSRTRWFLTGLSGGGVKSTRTGFLFGSSGRDKRPPNKGVKGERGIKWRKVFHPPWPARNRHTPPTRGGDLRLWPGRIFPTCQTGRPLMRGVEEKVGVNSLPGTN